MVERCRAIVSSRWFRRGVLGLIVLNALMMGLETWPEIAQAWRVTFEAAHVVVQVAFVLELGIRLAAHGRRPSDFFRDGWNVFDLIVVALSLLPVAGPFASVARLARVLRVARMVTAMPELRLIVGTMLRSIPSMGHVVMLLALLVYVYGVVGNHLFAQVDPAHWGTLGRAAHTLFIVMTLEGWVEIMRVGAEATPWAWLYFLSFIVVAVFVVINLFIAVVINNLEKARKEDAPAEAAADGDADLRGELRALASKVDELLALAGRASGGRPQGPEERQGK